LVPEPTRNYNRRQHPAIAPQQMYNAQQPPALRAVVFDFDLTLVDSVDGVTECANHALNALGFPAAGADRVRRTIGLTLEQTFTELSGSTNPALMAGYVEHYRQRADRVMVDLVRPFAGVATTLEAARRSGHAVAIVSNRYRYRIEAILDRHRLGAHVDAIIGVEDVARHKPHPEGIQAALRALAVLPADAIYVGDHPVDAMAAAAAGVAFVGVLSGVMSRAGWIPHAPAAVIESVTQLPTALRWHERFPGDA
jgi:phosphoglycolate phosphatase